MIDNTEEPDTIQEFVELEELPKDDEDQTDSDYSYTRTSSGSVQMEADLPFRHLKLISNLEHSRIPAVVLDLKLNIIWENNSYTTLFLQKERDLPVNLVSDFSPFLTTEKLGLIFKNITDKSTGYSFKGRVESKHRNRLNIIANLIINPYTDNIIYDETDSSPVLFVGIFDDISEENKALLEGTFLSLLEASKLKDNDTGNHIKRVGEYSKSISKKLFNNPAYPEVNADFIENIFFLAPMHDVGKIGTPDHILTKAGALTSEEWITMKEHPKSGALILSAYPDPMAAHIANFHHEKWDGTGYPYGFSELLIPLAARIVAISDVYDALRMKRTYKEAFSHKKAVEIIRKDAGSHFDPDLVKIFIDFNSEFENSYEQLKDA